MCIAAVRVIVALALVAVLVAEVGGWSDGFDFPDHYIYSHLIRQHFMVCKNWSRDQESQ